MAEIDTENLAPLFSPSNPSSLDAATLETLSSLQRSHFLSAQELFYKWESYCLKMGEDTRLDLGTVRMFSKDVQEQLERGGVNQQGGKSVRSERKSNVGVTPRAVSNGDMFGMLDDLSTPSARGKVERTSAGSAKRKNEFETPMPAAKRKSATSTAWKGLVEGQASVSFAERANPGQVLETLNEHLPAAEAPIAPFPETRIRVVANTDIKKFGYKPMSMRMSDSSEVLDERIDDFLALVQKHHGLEDGVFGNAASQSTNEIVAVGRIASDTPGGKFNSASVVLEMSRRMGAGLRVTLNVAALKSYSFFPGQMVAVRGTNANGLYFTVKDILEVPPLPIPVSTPAVIDSLNERLGVDEESTAAPLNVVYVSGPYTADANLDFEPLQALCTKAAEDMVDAIVMTGPFLDTEHPLLSSGDFDLPDVKGLDNDPSMDALFSQWISTPIQKLCQAVPSITIIMVPSVRDVASKHVSWPQEQLTNKKDLGLPKQVKLVPNPCFISLNETVLAISSQDILYELSRGQLSHGPGLPDLLTRLPGYLIQQRHFFPLFPPMDRDGTNKTGANLDLGYLKLGEWLNVRPDVLVVPSLLTPSVKVSDDHAATLILPN